MSSSHTVRKVNKLYKSIELWYTLMFESEQQKGCLLQGLPLTINPLLFLFKKEQALDILLNTRQYRSNAGGINLSHNQETKPNHNLDCTLCQTSLGVIF